MTVNKIVPRRNRIEAEGKAEGKVKTAKAAAIGDSTLAESLHLIQKNCNRCFGNPIVKPPCSKTAEIEKFKATVMAILKENPAFKELPKAQETVAKFITQFKNKIA